MSAKLLEHFVADFGTEYLLRKCEIQAPPNEATFIHRLYEALQEIVIDLESAPKERHKDDEDRISVEIVLALRGHGFSATKDTTQGGHVDIHVSAIRKPQMRWYGEAKIWKGPKYLRGGLNQLLLRYATGRQTDLGLLIYFQKPGIVTRLREWKRALHSSANQIQLKHTNVLNNFTLESEHLHKSGATVRVRHIGINLDWSPGQS